MFYRLLYCLLLYVITGIQRRTIYEYHRVEVDFGRIQSNTIVILDPLISMSQKKWNFFFFYKQQLHSIIEKRQHLWNQFKVLPWTYLYICGGSMCVDNQNFANLLGHNFAGYWFVALQCNMIYYMHWVIHS